MPVVVFFHRGNINDSAFSFPFSPRMVHAEALSERTGYRLLLTGFGGSDAGLAVYLAGPALQWEKIKAGMMSPSQRQEGWLPCVIDYPRIHYAQSVGSWRITLIAPTHQRQSRHLAARCTDIF